MQIANTLSQELEHQGRGFRDGCIFAVSVRMSGKVRCGHRAAPHCRGVTQSGRASDAVFAELCFVSFPLFPFLQSMPLECSLLTLSRSDSLSLSWGETSVEWFLFFLGVLWLCLCSAGSRNWC